jgi:ribose 5-phosphate isomerase B
MLVYTSSDHAGFELKNFLVQQLLDNGHEVVDCGAFTYDENDDYPDFIIPCMRELKESLQKGLPAVGIIFGSSGTGEAIVANKFKNIRAVVCNSSDERIVELGRAHNDANVLSVGARFIEKENLMQMVEVFLKTPFEGGRHERRIEKINKLVS